MVYTKTLTNYDVNADDFDNFRQPNAIIKQKLIDAFSLRGGPILSVGCGTGKYEGMLSEKFEIVGIDRSKAMIHKAMGRMSNAVVGDMTSLPFVKNSFLGAYFMQSLHHVGANLKIGVDQRNDSRINVLRQTLDLISHGPIFIIQRDPTQNQAVWFWKYFPRALEIKLVIQPKVEMLVDWLERFGVKNVKAEPVFDSMSPSFFDPQAPLDPKFRRSFSDFSYLTKDEIRIGVRDLLRANRDGSVMDVIAASKLRFSEIGGTVFFVSGEKHYS
jgi:SAM-dependent methyltransferase